MLPVKDVEFWFPCSRLTLTNAAERGLKGCCSWIERGLHVKWSVLLQQTGKNLSGVSFINKDSLNWKSRGIWPFVRILSAELAKNSLLKIILQTLQTQKWHRFPMINVLLFELGSVVFFFSRRQTEISLFVLPGYWIYVHLNFIALNAKFVENNK